MHRPLTEGIPWAFEHLPGVCPESLENTNNECVPYQLSKFIKIKGKLPYTKNDILDLLANISIELYENDDINSPYDDMSKISEIGFTGKCIVELCKYLQIPVHIKGGNSKIESYNPTSTAFDDVCIYIYGDHMYVIDDPILKRNIIKEDVSTPTPISETSLAAMGKHLKTNPGAQYWESYQGISPGHFKTWDLSEVRLQLLREGICPKISLSGAGKMKSLKYNDMTIHSWPQDGYLCLKFLEVLSQYRKHAVQYRGESLSMFGQLIFDEFNKPCDRTYITDDVRKELRGLQSDRCAICGDMMLKEVDHVLPRGGQCYGKDEIERRMIDFPSVVSHLSSSYQSSWPC